jgi:hypothetical protein
MDVSCQFALYQRDDEHLTAGCIATTITDTTLRSVAHPSVASITLLGTTLSHRALDRALLRDLMTFVCSEPAEKIIEKAGRERTVRRLIDSATEPSNDSRGQR